MNLFQDKIHTSQCLKNPMRIWNNLLHFQVKTVKKTVFKNQTLPSTERRMTELVGSESGSSSPEKFAQL